MQLLDRYATESAEQRALAVDDKAKNRTVLRRALEKKGWQVSEAENSRVMLDQLPRYESEPN